MKLKASLKKKLHLCPQKLSTEKCLLRKRILPFPIKTACELSYVVVSSSESIGPSVRSKDNGAFATG